MSKMISSTFLLNEELIFVWILNTYIYFPDTAECMSLFEEIIS